MQQSITVMEAMIIGGVTGLVCFVLAVVLFLLAVRLALGRFPKSSVDLAAAVGEWVQTHTEVPYQIDEPFD